MQKTKLDRDKETVAAADIQVMEVLRKAKLLAQRYRALTGKPLGITGEVAEYEAARLLRLKLTPARNAGFDATECKNGSVRRLQIKGRCLLKELKTRPAPRAYQHA